MNQKFEGGREITVTTIIFFDTANKTFITTSKRLANEKKELQILETIRRTTSPQYRISNITMDDCVVFVTGRATKLCC